MDPAWARPCCLPYLTGSLSPAEDWVGHSGLWRLIPYKERGHSQANGRYKREPGNQKNAKAE